jgi:diamine N-acetyltransferase
MAVGFIRYEINNERSEMYVYRFMIDRKYQGKGLGKGTLDKLKEIARENSCKLIKLSTSRKNRHGISVYEAAGFIDIHEMHYGEEVFVYICETVAKPNV